MYKVYLDDKPLIDAPAGLVVIDPILELAQNAAGSFSFSFYPDHPLYEQITPTSRIDFYQVKDGQKRWIWSGRPLSIETDFDLQKSVDCEGVLGWLADTIQLPNEYHDLSVIQLLKTFIDAHNLQTDPAKKFNLGVVTVTDPNDSLYRYTNYETTLEAIKDKLVDRLGGMLRIRKEQDGFYLDYLKDYPRTSIQPIELGQNLIDLLKESSFTSVGTVLIPLGAKVEEQDKDPNFPKALEQRVTIASVNDGVDSLSSGSAIADYGTIVKVQTWDDVHIPALLKTKAQQYLDLIKYEQTTIEATAVDLSLAGIEIDDFRFLDRIVVHSTPHNVDLTFPLVEMKIYPLDPQDSKYTLGGQAKSYTSSVRSAQSSLKAEIAERPTISHTRQLVIENSTKILQQWASVGYAIHTENESFYMDHPDKTKAVNVLRINLGGIGFSSTGIDGPYRQAWTLDGHFNTDFIDAGSIRSEHLSSIYKASVQKQITDTVEGKAKNYWTMLETQTAIQQGDKGVELYAKTYADKLVGDELRGYYTKAQIDLKDDQIKQSVESAKSYAGGLVQDVQTSLAAYDTKENALQRVQNILKESKDYTDSTVDEAIKKAAVGQLVNVYTKSEIHQREDAINQSIAQVRQFAQMTANNSTVTENYYTKSAIDHLLSSLALSVREDKTIHSSNLLDGTPEWDFPSGSVSGTKEKDGDAYALAVNRPAGSTETQFFSLAQKDVPFSANEFYTLSIEVNAPADGSIKLKIAYPVWKIVKAIARGGADLTVTHSDTEAVVTCPIRAGVSTIALTIQLGGKLTSEEAWRWDPFNFEEDFLKKSGRSTEITGWISASARAGVWKFKKLQLERGKEVTPYNAGVTDLTTRYAQIKVDLDGINLSVTKAKEYAKSYADGLVGEKLQSYYKKAEIDLKVDQINQTVTSVTNSVNSRFSSIESSIGSLRTTANSIDAKVESTKQTVSSLNSNLNSVRTSVSNLSIRADGISSTVSQKLNASELSTRIQQSYNDVRISWNKVSDVIQFSRSGIKMYDGGLSESNMRLWLSGKGAIYYYKGQRIGWSGSGHLEWNQSVRSLQFHLDPEGTYIGWADRRSSSDSYGLKFFYAAKSFEGFPAGRLHVLCDLNMANNTIINPNFRQTKDSAAKSSLWASQTVYLPVTRPYGTSYACRIVNGIIYDA